MWKKRLEGFYYGLLMTGFFSFMEWWQEGNIERGFFIYLCLLPFISSWWCSSKFIDKFYK